MFWLLIPALSGGKKFNIYIYFLLKITKKSCRNRYRHLDSILLVNKEEMSEQLLTIAVLSMKQ
jgi:hypothetical protein